MSEVVVTSQGNLRNEVRYGAGHSFITDEPADAGGEDAGPDPYTLLLAALGSCISMTVTLYARRKQWPLEGVEVRLRQNRIHTRNVRSVSKTRRASSTASNVQSFHGPLSEDKDNTSPGRSQHKCPVPKDTLF